jgi:hypothetical protein
LSNPLCSALGLSRLGLFAEAIVRSLRFLNSTEARALPAGIDGFIARFLAWRM